MTHVLTGAAAAPAQPIIRDITYKDLREALRLGWEDFTSMPSHAIFLCIIYPVVGIVLAQFILGYAVVPFLYPLAAGFALLGPIAALGLYELSRRREAGLEASAADALDVLHSPSIGAIAALGVLMLLIFGVWIAVANAIYVANFGYAMPASLSQFVHDLFTTQAGWTLIIVGNLVGFLFAALLWHEVLAAWKQAQEEGLNPLPALFKAMDHVIHVQGEKLSIPRRFGADMKDIWALQPRFLGRSGRRPYSVLMHPRFRAAYDFLVLRCDSGEVDAEIAEWWENFQKADEEIRKQMLLPDRSPRRRRRRRKPAGAKPEAEVVPTGSE